MTLTWTLLRRAFCVVALVALSADLASAAPARLASNTNLRQGPGTDFGVLATVRGGTLVNVVRCSGEWCNVTVRGRPGYMIGRNLRRGAVIRRAAVVAQPVVVARPVVAVYGSPYYGGYYGYGPRYYGYGPRLYAGPRYYGRRW